MAAQTSRIEQKLQDVIYSPQGREVLYVEIDAGTMCSQFEENLTRPQLARSLRNLPGMSRKKTSGMSKGQMCAMYGSEILRIIQNGSELLMNHCGPEHKTPEDREFVRNLARILLLVPHEDESEDKLCARVADRINQLKAKGTCEPNGIAIRSNCDGLYKKNPGKVLIAVIAMGIFGLLYTNAGLYLAAKTYGIQALSAGSALIGRGIQGAASLGSQAASYVGSIFGRGLDVAQQYGTQAASTASEYGAQASSLGAAGLERARGAYASVPDSRAVIDGVRDFVSGKHNAASAWISSLTSKWGENSAKLVTAGQQVLIAKAEEATLPVDIARGVSVDSGMVARS